VVHIEGTIKQAGEQKMVSNSALKNRCLHTTNTNRSKRL